MKTNQDQRTVGVTKFKPHCLGLIDDVAKGKTSRIVLMKHNKPVAAIIPYPQAEEPVELWGAMHGTVKIAPGYDLTQGLADEWPEES